MKMTDEQALAAWFCDGPEGYFYHDNLSMARKLVNLIDPEGDDWTITSMANPFGSTEALPVAAVESFNRGWLKMDGLPGGMMESSKGRFGPVPATTGCTVTTSDLVRAEWVARGEPALEIFTSKPADSAGVTEVRLWDSQWVAVVNHERGYEGWKMEDAIHHAVKMTERLIAENLALGKLPPTRAALSAARGK